MEPPLKDSGAKPVQKLQIYLSRIIHKSNMNFAKIKCQHSSEGLINSAIVVFENRHRQKASDYAKRGEYWLISVKP